jgi:chorismate dehydratase
LKNTKLRIGRIPYANLFPIFYYLDRECDHSAYRFIKGVPSTLNKMLREGKLDISPSSSIEYLRNKNKYFILPWFSISSSGPISSILLFSKLPLEELGGKTIAASSDSETSLVLLKIILREFLSLKCRFKTIKCSSVKKVLSSFPAALLIGDEAMKEAKKAVTRYELRVTSENQTSKLRTLNSKLNPSLVTRHSSLHIYDLGELWTKYTGLPFVFALWIVRKEPLSQKKELIKKLSSDLINAKKYASKKFSLIAKEAPQKKWSSEEELVHYWKDISYDFTDKHMEGLKLFEKYAFKN